MTSETKPLFGMREIEEREIEKREKEEKLEIFFVWQEEKLRREKNKWWAHTFFVSLQKCEERGKKTKKSIMPLVF